MDVCYFARKEHFLHCNWQDILFLFATLITAPLYAIIISTIVLRRDQRPFKELFYSIILSQGLADFLAVTFFIVLHSTRQFYIYPRIFLQYDEYIAPISIILTDYFVALRCFGDCLFSIQRLIVFRFSHTRFGEGIDKCSLLQVMLLHWTMPALAMLPSILGPSVRNIVEIDGEVQDSVSWGYEATYSLILASWVVLLFGICLCCDLYLMYHVWQISRNDKQRANHEVRISFVVIGQAFSFALIVVYYITLARLMLHKPSPLWPLIQRHFSTVNGLESYVNPWLYIILNSHLRKEVLTLMGVKKPCVIHVEMSSIQ